MLALGVLLRAGQSSPWQRSKHRLMVMRVRSACDNVRRPGVGNGLQRSLRTGGQRAAAPIPAVLTAMFWPHGFLRRTKVTHVRRCCESPLTAQPQRDCCLPLDLPL
jgi:hypothetical protein